MVGVSIPIRLQVKEQWLPTTYYLKVDGHICLISSFQWTIVEYNLRES
jgi:hypothetical protein